MSKGKGILSPALKQATSVTAWRGEGVYVYDRDDNRYLDFTSGIGVTSTGHCHPRVVEAAQKQVATMIHAQYATVINPRLLELSEKLAELMPGDIDAVSYSNAGTEAIEGALRLVRHATGKPNVIVFQGGFHGRTMGSLSLTSSNVGLRTGIQPMMAGVEVAPFPHAHRYGWGKQETEEFCLRELDHLMATRSAPRETAAVLVEPVQGEAGYIPAGSTFMQGLRERCDRHGMLLVIDEVQAGFGRTGKFWGHEHFDVQPDIVITAKGLASGFPISAFAANRDLLSQSLPGTQGGTYGGNAVAAAAALATIEVFREENLVENAAKMGARLREGLESLQKQYPEMDDVRGMGLMQGVEMRDGDGKLDGERTGKLVAACEKHGMLMLRCGAYLENVRFLPPLIVNAEQIDQALSIFETALKETRA